MAQAYPEPTVGALIINKAGEVLLPRSSKWRNKFTVPGGHIELGETVEDALKREVKEEVGIDVEPIKLLLMQQAIFSEEFEKRRHFIFLDYLCKAKTTKVVLDKVELQAYMWVKPEKALDMDVDPFTRNLLIKYLESKKGSPAG